VYCSVYPLFTCFLWIFLVPSILVENIRSILKSCMDVYGAGSVPLSALLQCLLALKSKMMLSDPESTVRCLE
jgi:hypothetical protein